MKNIQFYFLFLLLITIGGIGIDTALGQTGTNQTFIKLLGSSGVEVLFESPETVVFKGDFTNVVNNNIAANLGNAIDAAKQMGYSIDSVTESTDIYTIFMSKRH